MAASSDGNLLRVGSQAGNGPAAFLKESASIVRAWEGKEVLKRVLYIALS